MSAFIDYVEVAVKAGNGGDGLVSFRREKFVDRGGPDGGDGGDGGSVVARASHSVNTLQNYRSLQMLSAEPGQSGGPQKRHGKRGENLEILVPVGTMVKDGQRLVADLIEDGQTAVIAAGGKGGFGNAHFVSSTRQTPRVAENGESGQAYKAVLELKLLADVGLVGLPNAGKSTFLSVVSNARPAIADYPFTTLVPNLGVADVSGRSLLIADIPGLIEGASDGKGLGDAFLRHIERTAVILHLIDAFSSDPAADYKTISKELKSYSLQLAKKPVVVALTKIESLDKDIIDDQLKQLKKVLPKATQITTISSVKAIGTKSLLAQLVKLVERERKKAPPRESISIEKVDEAVWSLERTKQGWLVRGAKIEAFARRTNFGNSWGVNRLKDIMGKMGINRELKRQGAKPGDTIAINGINNTLEL